MLTVEQAIARFGVEIDEHLDRQVRIPIVDGLQAQGDIIVVPQPHALAATEPVPAAGFPVVQGEVGANTHLLVADGVVFWDDGRQYESDLDLGVLTVHDDAVGYLIHPEHGATGIAPGTYVVRRQREQADEVRLVAD